MNFCVTRMVTALWRKADRVSLDFLVVFFLVSSPEKQNPNSTFHVKKDVLIQDLLIKSVKPLIICDGG